MIEYKCDVCGKNLGIKERCWSVKLIDDHLVALPTYYNFDLCKDCWDILLGGFKGGRISQVEDAG